MAKEAPVSDPLAWLHDSLETALASVGATVDHQYSSPSRGSLTITREGRVMQTSYFSSWEIEDLRNGGQPALEKQKAAIMEQINRLLNPPKPQPINLQSVAAPKRGRGAKKPAAAEEAEATETTEATSDAAEPTEAAEAPETAEGGEEASAEA